MKGAKVSRSVRTRAAQAAAETLAVVLSTAIVAGMGVYANRRGVAQGLAETWLRDQGIPGVLRIERLDADGFSGSLLIGPEGDPDLSVERVEVDLALNPVWSADRLKLSARAVRLVRPRLKADLDARGLTFGRLDPVVRDFLARPPDETAVGPVVLIEDGQVRLGTDYGPITFGGSGAIDDGRLVRLDGAVRPARLKSDRFAAALDGGAFRLTGAVDRLTGRVNLDVATLTSASFGAEGADLVLNVDAPYPDGAGAQLNGPLVVEGTLNSDVVTTGGERVRGLRSAVNLGGRLEGPLTVPAFSGRATLTGSALALSGPQLAGETLALRASLLRLDAARTADGLRLTTAGDVDLRADRLRSAQGTLERPALRVSSGAARLAGGDLSGPVSARLQAARFVRPDLTAAGVIATVQSDLSLLGGTAPLAVDVRAARMAAPIDRRPLGVDDVAVRFAGPARIAAGRLAWTATGAASAEGGFAPADAARLAARVPVLSGEDSHGEDIRRALAAFSLRAPGLTLGVDAGRTTLASTSPVRMDARSGAKLTLAGRPLLALAGGGVSGAATLTTEGGGLPTLKLALTNWRAGAGGFDSAVRLTAAGLDAAIARGATVTAAGRARLTETGFRFDATGCIPVTAAEIEFGESDLAAATAEVCPAPGAPLVTTDARGYRLQGRFRRAGLDWPVSQVRAAEAEGGFDVRGAEAGLTTAAVRLTTAAVTDAAEVKRYEPIRLSGGIDLGGGVWRGRFDAATPKGLRLGAVDVTHSEAAAGGSAVIDARAVTFAEGGLQPGDLTPLIAGISTGATGTVDFTGRFDWTPSGTTSSGRLQTQGLNFASPAGEVSAVKADIALVSLTPLISAPDQRITVSKVGAVTDLTDLVTVFTLLENEVRVASTEFEVAGGRARFEPLVIPLTENATYSGTLLLDDVQLGELVESLNLAKSLSLDAVVDGRLPFEIGPGKVRFARGTLTAVKPGRISIKREALTQVAAGETDSPGAPSATAPPVNAIQDFAYQAMENLAFQHLDVEVNSLPEGRLGLLFKIQGEHDPAVGEEARVGILEAIRGRLFDRRIPLPKGTPVNLTLDTTLNFDELLAAWLDVARSRAAAEAEQP